jgi:hypothetical protein
MHVTTTDNPVEQIEWQTRNMLADLDPATGSKSVPIFLPEKDWSVESGERKSNRQPLWTRILCLLQTEFVSHGWPAGGGMAIPSSPRLQVLK